MSHEPMADEAISKNEGLYFFSASLLIWSCMALSRPRLGMWKSVPSIALRVTYSAADLGMRSWMRRSTIFFSMTESTVICCRFSSALTMLI